MKTILFVTAIATAALALPMSGHAQESTQDVTPPITLKMAKTIGLNKALEIASSELEGTIIEAELDTWGGAHVFEVDMLDGKVVRQVKIDAQSGNIVSVRRKHLNYLVNRLVQDEQLAAARQGSWPLVDYIKAVEAKTGGEVTEINLDSEKGLVYIEMTFIKNGVEQEITVDPRTDSILIGEIG